MLRNEPPPAVWRIKRNENGFLAAPAQPECLPTCSVWEKGAGYCTCQPVPQAAPAQPSWISDETGWLIEKGQLCLGSCDRKPSWVTFTDPTAVRFARKVDAENMLNSLRSMSDAGAFQNCTISDHAWVGPTRFKCGSCGKGYDHISEAAKCCPAPPSAGTEQESGKQEKP